MNKDIENLKNILVDLEDAERGAIINLSQEEIDSLKTILNLTEKQQKELENYKNFKKDIVSKIMFWDKEELPDNERIIEMIDTLISEVSRLEDIEDKKIEVAIDLIEEKRDKFWQDKIREKIKELKKCKDISQVVGSIVVLEELLGDNIPMINLGQ